MVSQELLNYIKQQLSLGKSRADIEPVLLKANWSQDDINQAFTNPDSPASTLTPMPPSGTRSDLPSFSTLYKEAWELCKKRVGVMVLSGLTLVVGILIFGIISAIITFIVFKTAGTVAGLITGIVLGGITFIAYIYAALWGIAAQYIALRDAAENTGIKENLRRAKPFIGSVFLVSFLVSLASIGGYILLIVPGIILTIRYGFSQFIIVSEGKKGRMAIAQSKAYVTGRTGKVFLRLLSVYVIYLAPYIILQILIANNKNSVLGIICTILLIILQLGFAFYAQPFFYTLYKQLKETAGPTDPQKYVKGVTWWAVWGVVGWVVVIGGLSVGLLALNSARMKARDAKRVADIQSLNTYLNLYHNDYKHYPQSLHDLIPGYLNQDATAPTPEDGSCTTQENEYSYTPAQDLQNYKINFCLGQQTGSFNAGVNTVTSNNPSVIPSSSEAVPVQN